MFSDVSTQINKDAIEHIAKNFENPKVGAVSSEDRFISEQGTIVGEGAYVRYEMWLRRLESSVNSLVGLSGSFFAARQEICDDWDIQVPSDFNTAINSVRKGFVAVSDPEVLGFYPDIKDEKREYQRKLRTVIRGISALYHHPEILNPFRFGLFAYQMWSHKVMRWLVPWFLLGLLLSTLILLDQHWFYQLCLGSQFIFYALAIVGLLSKRLRANAVFKIPFFFVQVNLALAHATIAFAFGKRMTVWEPSKR